MHKMRTRLNLILKAMEKGIKIETDSGWVDMVAGEPGFVMTQISGGMSQEVVHLIGSQEAWMVIVGKARCLTEEEIVKLGFSVGMDWSKDV